MTFMEKALLSLILQILIEKYQEAKEVIIVKYLTSDTYCILSG
jgi:hypothetical protein